MRQRGKKGRNNDCGEKPIRMGNFCSRKKILNGYIVQGSNEAKTDLSRHSAS